MVADFAWKTKKIKTHTNPTQPPHFKRSLLESLVFSIEYKRTDFHSIKSVPGLKLQKTLKRFVEHAVFLKVLSVFCQKIAYLGKLYDKRLLKWKYKLQNKSKQNVDLLFLSQNPFEA